MTRSSGYRARYVGAARPNFWVALTCCSAVGVLVLNFQLEPIGGLGSASAAQPTRFPQLTSIRTSSPTAEISCAAMAGDPANLPQAALQDQQNKQPADTNHSQPTIFEGRLALLLNLALLEDGMRQLKKYTDYTATFFKQEWLDDDDEIGEPQVVELKIRHTPFSAYMKWVEGDNGQEALYVAGQHNNKILVQLGGWKGRMLKTLKLDPHGSLAMGKSRYPITQAGLMNLAQTIADYRKRDLAALDHVKCRLEEGYYFQERPCYRAVVEFDSEDFDPVYRKSVILIDKQWSFPVVVKNYGWFDEGDEELAGLAESELDEATLIEFYSYTNVRFNQRLGNGAFEPSNEQYAFKL